MRDPALATGHAASLTMASGNHLRAVLRYEDFVYQSQKLRLFDACLEQGGRPEPTEKERRAKASADAIVRRLWGGMELVDFLKTQFTTEEDVLDIPEHWPRFTVNERDEVVRIPAS